MTRFSTATSGPAGLSNWNTESSCQRYNMPVRISFTPYPPSDRDFAKRIRTDIRPCDLEPDRD